MTAPVYLVTGHEFLAGEVVDRIRAETGGEPLAEASFDETSEPHAVIGALETPSLLGGRRLVVVHGAHALSRDQTDALLRYLRSPSPHSVLVLLAQRRTKLADAVAEVGALVTVEAPRGRGLVSWIRERARGHGVRVDDRAGWALIDSVGVELRDLDAALEQLAAAFGADARVGSAEVRRMFGRLADERVYAFTDAVGDRRLDVAMTALRRLLEQGEEPLVLFGSLAAHIRRLILARGVAEGGPRAVAEALGMPSWRAERIHRQARSYREEELVAAMGAVAAADVEMKSGDLPAGHGGLALERAVIEIVRRGA